MSASPPPSLYDLLRVSKDASPGELRKAFLRLALVLHPDKRPNDPHAADDFRALRRAYEILSDAKARERYDRTGVTPDDESSAFADAYERYRGVRVEPADVDRALAAYRGSAEETRDLVEFLVSRAGNVRDALGFIEGSRDEDVPRFVEIWERALEERGASAEVRAEFERAKREIRSEAELDGAGDDGDDDDAEDLEEEDEDEDEDDEDDDDMKDFIAGSDEDEDEEDADGDADADSDSDSETGRDLLKLTKGDRVDARWKGGRRWYPARVTRASRDGASVDLAYDDGATETDVKRSLVRARAEAAKGSTSGKTEAKPDAKPKTKAEPQAKTSAGSGSGAGRKTKPSDSDEEVSDMDALRRAILEKNAKRAEGFAEFESRWRAHEASSGNGASASASASAGSRGGKRSKRA